MRTAKRTKFLLAGVSAAVVLILIFAAVTLLNSNNGVVNVLKINDIYVDAREFMLVIKQERSDVLSYYNSNYSVEVDEDFWHTELDGETPADRLKNQAIDRLVEIKIQQSLMLENGIIDSMEYSDFLKEYEEEMERRQQLIESGDVTYGAEEYTVELYYNNQFSKNVVELRNALAEGDLKPTESEIQRYYDLVCDQQFIDEQGNVKPLSAVYDLVCSRVVERDYNAYVEELSSEAQVKELSSIKNVVYN